jgi:hypothetical protein
MSFPNLIVKVSSVMQETAIALNAAARLQPPARTVVVDTAYIGVSSPWQFGTVADALAYVRAQTGVWLVIVGQNLALPEGENIKDLADEGIIVRFSLNTIFKDDGKYYQVTADGVEEITFGATTTKMGVDDLDLFDLDLTEKISTGVLSGYFTSTNETVSKISALINIAGSTDGSNKVIRVAKSFLNTVAPEIVQNPSSYFINVVYISLSSNELTYIRNATLTSDGDFLTIIGDPSLTSEFGTPINVEFEIYKTS